MRTLAAIGAAFAVSIAVLVSSVALAQRTLVYEPSQTRLDNCISVCRQGAGQFSCSGQCVSRTADGGFPRHYEVDASGGTMNACLTALSAECVP